MSKCAFIRSEGERDQIETEECLSLELQLKEIRDRHRVFEMYRRRLPVYDTARYMGALGIKVGPMAPQESLLGRVYFPSEEK